MIPFPHFNPRIPGAVPQTAADAIRWLPALVGYFLAAREQPDDAQAGRSGRAMTWIDLCLSVIVREEPTIYGRYAELSSAIHALGEPGTRAEAKERIRAIVATF